MYKEQTNAVVAKHDEEIEMNHIQAKLELLELAHAKVDDVNVPNIDWLKLGKQVKVADNKNFITSEEAGKIESQEHYRAILSMYKEQTNAVVAKHDEEIEMNHIQAKLELLDKLIEGHL
ncbi:hypothetical protein F2Q68_00034860 [Brassica cretica]|uniref:Uncharacterized protein n=1 Tax=Brassica cretica TaxID=69181 RepID=A0A8S9H7E7_BRACR|nr:hypothetical protein F2Q68_00034860 [Brassica cretica]